MTSPLVSYVITVFNKRPYLDHLLAGLSAQIGDFDREYIFIDDGSRDGGAEAIETATADWPRARVIRQANAGPAAALNRGFAEVAGDVVKPLDGDDILAPHATAALMAALARHEADCAWVAADNQETYAVNEAPEAWLRRRPVDDASELIGDPLAASIRRARTTPTGVILTRRALQRIGGCDQGVFIQDYSLELRLAALDRCALAHGVILAGPREAPGRLSSDGAQTLHDMNRALVRFLADHPLLPRRHVRAGMRRAAGRAWLWARRHAGIAETARAALTALAAEADLLAPTPEALAAVCRPFRATGPIRIPPG